MNPKVSLIIPVYNVEQYLKKCLNSATNQTLQEIEIIIVNDGSTDGSLAICEAYANRDSRIKLISQRNGGLSAARNTGIEASNGEYIAFLDSDDWLELSTLDSTYKKAKEENLDIVIYGYKKIDDGNNIIFTNVLDSSYSHELFKKRIFSAQMSPMACAKLYKTDLFKLHDIYFPVGYYHEDVYTTYKLAFFANKIGVIEQAYYNWLIRNGSISQGVTKKHINDILDSLTELKNFLISNDSFSEYKIEYIRRAYSFSLLMIDKISRSKDSLLIKKQLKELVFKKLDKLSIGDEESLNNLKIIDKQLFNKYIKTSGKEMEVFQLVNLKGEKMLRKIADVLLPKGSRNREIVKQLLGRGENKSSGEISKAAEVNSSVKPKPKSNMLPVREAISEAEREKLRPLKDKFKGKRCFIVGNGPSLNKCDLSLLENEYTFAVNGIFYKTEEMGFKPTFYMVEDGHVVDDNLEKINAYDPEYKFFPAMYKKKIVRTDSTYFFTADLGFYRGDHESFEKPRFSKDFSEVSYCGQSVTYLNMQLAYYLGFSEVYLIGMDFSYAIRESDEVKGATLISNEDDINHFHPDYFGKGKKWHDPKVYNVAKNYEFAKVNFEADGRNIYNATVGGKLEIFDRKDYSDLFKK